MRWFVILGVIFGFYYYFLTQTTNVVMNQVQQLHNEYSYVANNADKLGGASR